MNLRQTFKTKLFFLRARVKNTKHKRLEAIFLPLYHIYSVTGIQYECNETPLTYYTIC